MAAATPVTAVAAQRLPGPGDHLARPGDRDFTGYIANVLLDDWDQVRADAAILDRPQAAGS